MAPPRVPSSQASLRPHPSGHLSGHPDHHPGHLSGHPDHLPDHPGHPDHHPGHPDHPGHHSKGHHSKGHRSKKNSKGKWVVVAVVAAILLVVMAALSAPAPGVGLGRVCGRAHSKVCPDPFVCSQQVGMPFSTCQYPQECSAFLPRKGPPVMSPLVIIQSAWAPSRYISWDQPPGSPAGWATLGGIHECVPLQIKAIEGDDNAVFITLIGRTEEQGILYLQRSVATSRLKFGPLLAPPVPHGDKLSAEESAVIMAGWVLLAPDNKVPSEKADQFVFADPLRKTALAAGYCPDPFAAKDHCSTPGGGDMVPVAAPYKAELTGRMCRKGLSDGPLSWLILGT